MLKKVTLCFIAFFLAACQQFFPSEKTPLRRPSAPAHLSGADLFSPQFEVTDLFENTQSYQVAMLLPLSGKASSIGKGLKNAAMMALEDVKNNNLIVRFYDTKSTPYGASSALEEALNAGSKLVLGPLLSEEVSAVSHRAHRADVPVISFSTSPSVLGNGVYTLGLLGQEQIERIITYATQNGRNNFAVLVPDTPAGLNMAKSAFQTAQKQGANVIKIAFYPPETIDFAEVIQNMTDYKARSAQSERQKAVLKQRAANGDSSAAASLKRLQTQYSSGRLDFDAVLIPETGNRLKSIAGMFGYYDVSYPDVLFLGTSMWENTNLTKETTLYHGLYPAISRVHGDYFNKKYQDLFGELPNQLYTYAYDGIALASALSRQNPEEINFYITDADGYIGINGPFRIFTDGTNEHSLDIVQITADGLEVIDAGTKKFSAEKHFSAPVQMPDILPVIYGKDQNAVYRELFQKPEETYRFNFF